MISYLINLHSINGESRDQFGHFDIVRIFILKENKNQAYWYIFFFEMEQIYTIENGIINRFSYIAKHCMDTSLRKENIFWEIS